MWDQSTDAWRKALNVKPTPDFLTEPDKKLKLQSKPALIQKMPKRERKSPLSNPRLFDFISKKILIWKKLWLWKTNISTNGNCLA